MYHCIPQACVLIDVIFLVAIACIGYMKWSRKRAVKKAMILDNIDALQSTLAKFNRHHALYVLVELQKQGKANRSETIYATLLEFVRLYFPLVSFSEIGYRSSQPKMIKNIMILLLLFAGLFVLSTTIGLPLEFYSEKKGLLTVIQVLFCGLFAIVYAIVLFYYFSESRYCLSSRGIEIKPLLNDRFFVPWQAISLVRGIGPGRYALFWDSNPGPHQNAFNEHSHHSHIFLLEANGTSVFQIQNTFSELSYLPHLILSHINETVPLNSALKLLCELWPPPEKAAEEC